jgi:hypothetical protein
MAFIPALQNLLGLGLVALTLPVSCPAQGSDSRPGIPNLTLTATSEEIEDAFDEISTWQQHLTQKEGGALDLAVRGAFPVGDGHVFGSLGLGRRANTIRGLTGPGYATKSLPTHKGHFGEMSLDLLEGGKTVALENQHLWRVRGANVVISSDTSNDGLSIHTVNFAHPGSKTIYRWVEVQNLGSTARKIVLRVDWSGATPTPQGRLLLDNEKDGRSAELSSSIAGKAEQGQWMLDLGSIEAQKSKTVALHLRMTTTGKAYAGPEAAQKSCESALQGSLEAWIAKLAGTSSLSSDRQELADLMEDWKVLMLVQRDAESGAVIPMLGQRRSKIAENNGALLALLRYGLFTEAKQLLDYHVKAAIQSGKIQADLPADLDVSKVKMLETAEQWAGIQMPNDEISAWLILQHEWYFRATWDKSVLTDRWPFLVRLMESMKPAADASMPVSGKESYMQDRWFRVAGRNTAMSFLPADGPARHSRSLDNSILYLLSLNAMSELGEDHDKTLAGPKSLEKDWKSENKSKYEAKHLDILQKLEQTFWLPAENRFAPFLSPINGLPHRAPYAIPNLRLQWVGYTYALGEHNRENLRNSLAELWQNRTRVGMTPSIGATPGDLQGYLLYSLADLDDQNRGDCLDELIHQATPSAGWAEFYDSRGRPVDPDNSANPVRLRPSEAGINLDAIAFALNGIRYVVSPGWSKKDQRFKLRLPTKSRWLTLKNLRHDGHQFHIFLDERFVKDTTIDKSGKPVQKMRFRLRYVSVNKELGMQGTEHVDTAINVGDEVFVRYPSVQEEVMETGSWPVDKEKYLRKSGGPGPFAGAKIDVPEGTSSLVITSTIGGSRPDGSYVIDIGLPILPAQLAAAILAQPTIKRILFDAGSRELSSETQKGSEFWNHPSLQDAARKFAAAGGKVIAPIFIRNWGLSKPLTDDKTITDLTKPENFAKARSRIFKMEDSRRLLFSVATAKTAGKSTIFASCEVQSDKKRECTLRLGSNNAIRVWLNGKLVHENKITRHARADQDEVLVTLQEGVNRLLVQVQQVDNNGELLVRFTDLQALPIPTLTYK